MSALRAAASGNATAGSADIARLLAGIRHQRQQETGGDHEAKQRHHQRQHLRRRRQALDMVMRASLRRNEMHAGHRGVVHARHREAVGDRAQRQLHAALPRQEGAQAAIGGGDRDQDRQHHHRGVVRHRKIARQAMHADIMHAGDADPEQHRRGDHARQSTARRSLTKNSEIPTTSAQIRNETMVGSTR